ncbi:hypothetical protein HY493_00365 [Candidatus Woesearchaeota archaeon]|nr:hypothetical protein [Candidatus Woesearchaeota archaeon]
MKAKKHTALAKKDSPAQAIITIKTLGKAPEEKTFVLKDGRKLRTLYELIDELETMNDGLFKDYVNDSKNDFANWIEGVFNDEPLANELRLIKNRIDTQRAVLKHVVRELQRLAQ